MVEIRNVINNIDEQIEQQINEVKAQITEQLKMKLLTLEDYQSLVKHSGLSIGMLPKNFVRKHKPEDILKVMETLGGVTQTCTRRETDWTISDLIRKRMKTLMKILQVSKV